MVRNTMAMGRAKIAISGRRGRPPDGDEGDQRVEQGQAHGNESEPFPVIIPENVVREGKERHRVQGSISARSGMPGTRRHSRWNRLVAPARMRNMPVSPIWAMTGS